MTENPNSRPATTLHQLARRPSFELRDLFDPWVPWLENLGYYKPREARRRHELFTFLRDNAEAFGWKARQRDQQ